MPNEFSLPDRWECVVENEPAVEERFPLSAEETKPERPEITMFSEKKI